MEGGGSIDEWNKEGSFRERVMDRGRYGVREGERDDAGRESGRKEGREARINILREGDRNGGR